MQRSNGLAMFFQVGIEVCRAFEGSVWEEFGDAVGLAYVNLC